MPKDFGQRYMKYFEIVINLIDDGMLAQNFKTFSQESSSGDPLIFENVTKSYNFIITKFFLFISFFKGIK